MAFSKDVTDKAWTRAGGKCECTRSCRSHAPARCNAPLLSGKWHAHHILSVSAGGADTLANCEALCIPCHENTRSYGAH
jgi:5-methylcytosine-specific restriction endonuclease McrA